MIVHSNAFVYSTCLLGLDSRYGVACYWLYLYILTYVYIQTCKKIFPEPLLLNKGFVFITHLYKFYTINHQNYLLINILRHRFDIETISLRRG
jgi:hypothetical protein